MPDFYKVLSIDGGGIRGLIPAVFLAELEARLGKPLHKVFDLFAGTSTGGIIAGGLVAPALTGTGAAYSAGALVDFYMNEGGKIFYSPVYKKLTHLDDLVERKFDHKPLEKILKTNLGETRLKDALKELIITSYDLHGARPYFFKRWRAKENPGKRDHYLWQAIRATSAAPTYFEPYRLKNKSPKYDMSLVDGGMFANNPAMCAYAEAMKRKPKNKQILVVSLGTGDEDFGKPSAGNKYPHTKAKDWGVIGWARPAINIMMDGVADTVHHQLGQILTDKESVTSSNPQTYFRFQSGLNDKTKDMDDADEESLRELKKLGDKMVKENSDQIDKLVTKLTG